MRDRLLNAPWWALGLLTGVPFGVAMAVFVWVRGESWVVASIGGAVAGVLFGLLMGPSMYRQNQVARETFAQVAPESRPRVARATWRGPLPADPEGRAAAVRLVDHQLARLRRTRTLTFVVFTVALVLQTFSALTRSPWFWLGAAGFAALLAMTALFPGRLERRAALLREPPAGPVAGGSGRH